MPLRHEIIDGKKVFLSQAESDALDSEDAQFRADYKATLPMNNWKRQMRDSDNYMTRIDEDIIEALDAATKQRLNQEAIDKYNAKKALRAQKPL